MPFMTPAMPPRAGPRAKMKKMTTRTSMPISVAVLRSRAVARMAAPNVVFSTMNQMTSMSVNESSRMTTCRVGYRQSQEGKSCGGDDGCGISLGTGAPDGHDAVLQEDCLLYTSDAADDLL